MLQGRELKGGVFGGNYERAYVPGDGSCLFHSLACILDLRTSSSVDPPVPSYCQDECGWAKRVALGHRLREKIVDAGYAEYYHALQLPPGTVLSPTEAVDPSKFADEALIAFTARALDLTLYIVRSKTTVYAYPGRSVASQCAILAHTVAGSHFEPILPSEETVAASSSEYSCPLTDVWCGSTISLLPPTHSLFQDALFRSAMRP